MKQSNTQRTAKFLRWVNQYPGLWTLICTPGHQQMTTQKMGFLVRELAKESLDELIFVLLMVHREMDCVQAALHPLYFDAVERQWKAGERDRFVKDLLEYLK